MPYPRRIGAVAWLRSLRGRRSVRHEQEVSRRDAGDRAERGSRHAGATPTNAKKPALTKPVASAECKLTTAATGTVASVVDCRTLVLDDGREVRLAAIEMAPPNEAAGAAAKTALGTLTFASRSNCAAPAPETGRTAACSVTSTSPATAMSTGPRPSCYRGGAISSRGNLRGQRPACMRVQLKILR
jgi:hypothetical protein